MMHMSYEYLRQSFIKTFSKILAESYRIINYSTLNTSPPFSLSFFINGALPML